jgi:hypothetical protein
METLLIPLRKYHECRGFADGTRHNPRLGFLEVDAQVFCNLHPVISTNYCPFPSAEREREGGGGQLAGAELHLLGVSLCFLAFITIFYFLGYDPPRESPINSIHHVVLI